MKNIENTKIDYLNIGKFVGKTRSGQGLWECRCECGNEFIVDELYLNQKRFHSCSKCGYKKPWENKENVTSLRLYHTWNGIKQTKWELLLQALLEMLVGRHIRGFLLIVREMMMDGY